MWSSLFGGGDAQKEPTTAEEEKPAGEQISNFFQGMGNNIGSFFQGVANPEAAGDNSDAAAAGQAVANWFSDVGTSMNNLWSKATTPAEDKEQFAYVKHFGELPPTCLKPVVKQYVEQNLKDELFEDEWEVFQEMKKSPAAEGYSDRFIMACLFARKLDIKRTEEMLNHNKAWRIENGFAQIPSFEALNMKLVEEGKFALKCPGARGKNGEGIIYVKMGNMYPSKWGEEFIDLCVQMTVWNGMRGGLWETMDYFRNGIMMIADLSDMSWDNVDMTLQQRMSSALLDNFPMRTCKIMILHPPWILNAFLGGLRLVIKKKVMDRVYVVDKPEDLLEHVERDSLLKEYGGELEYSIRDWCNFIEEQSAKEGNREEKKSSSSSSSV
jgi:hypothetical protein